MQTETVIHHPTYGPALPNLNWVPAPRYLLRRDRVLRHLKKFAPCRILDIGCGAAALLSELSMQGYEAYGVDRSAQALEIGSHFQAIAPNLTLRSTLDEDWKKSFDLILSFEVIEHLEDDAGAIREWRDYLKPGGRLILSTPAHPQRWNAADEWAGHVRRYRREGLRQTVEAAGLIVEHTECYGFPLANIAELMRSRAYARALEHKQANPEALTNESGVDRNIEARYWRLFSGALPSLAMRSLCQIQRMFLQTDLGNGFLVIARAD